MQAMTEMAFSQDYGVSSWADDDELPTVCEYLLYRFLFPE